MNGRLRRRFSRGALELSRDGAGNVASGALGGFAMWKIVVVLLLTALAILLARLAYDAP